MSIKRLAPEVASKIAAGEVAERPFNVVKELMENALDAGASKITVEIAGGGLSLVKVSDNGRGIPEGDLSLALERFATSKAESVEDVYNAVTFGFRGEALAAISSVSDFTLRSGTAEGLAFEIKCKFGVTGQTKPAPAFVGTVAEAANLFENVPARRKFLKSSKSLENEIVRLVKHFSLINSDVELSLICEGKEVFRVLAAEDITLRAAKVFPGKGFYKGELRYGELFALSAATLPAQSDRLKRDAIVLGVNGRLIKDASLIQAVVRAYYRTIPDGRYPCCAVDIRILPSQVDSNVHPSKMEVRFENAKEIFAIVSGAVGNAFEGKGVNVTSVYSNIITGSASIKFDEIPVATEEELAFKRTLDFIPPTTKASFEKKHDEVANVETSKIEDINSRSAESFDTPITGAFGELPKSKVKATYAFDMNKAGQAQGVAAISKEDSPAKDFERKIGSGFLKVIGQIDASYIVCEADDKQVLFIDQHAAHERILFEKNKKGQAAGSKATIVLHEPIEASLAEEVFESLSSNKDVMNGFGYEYIVKDASSFLVEVIRIPYSAARRNVREEFIRIAEDLSLEGVSKRQDSPMAMLSCKSAVKAGDALTINEMEYLVRLLFNTDNFGTCPHGRPIIYAMSVLELSRKFLR